MTVQNAICLSRSDSQMTFPVGLREGGRWGLEKPACLASVSLAALSVREDALLLWDLSEETLGFAGRQTFRLLSGMSLVLSLREEPGGCASRPRETLLQTQDHDLAETLGPAEFRRGLSHTFMCSNHSFPLKLRGGWNDCRHLVYSLARNNCLGKMDSNLLLVQ